jgi:sirohydrochlorin ferrochelatase
LPSNNPSISDDIGIILIDHGSKRAAANEMLLEVVEAFKRTTGARIVEPAHMELANPTLAEAFSACVEQGAREIVIHPYFLAPGRHSTEDIPRMAEDAAKLHALTPYRVTEPLGIDTRMSEVILHRIQESLEEST